ncbi:MAG: tetratricopeptide repeat protein [Acidobacteriota bacterium]
MIRAAAAAAATVSAVLFLSAAALPADVSPAEVQEASEVARRAAFDVLRNPPARLFCEALDVDGIVQRRLGTAEWSGLTERQREELRAAVRERFLKTLAAPRSTTTDIPWSVMVPAGAGIDALFGLRYDDRLLKTRWVLRRSRGGWHIEDIVLTEPGVSLAAGAAESLGRRPIERRTRRQEIWSNAGPRLGAIGILALLCLALRFRVPKQKRALLYLTASAPAALFAIDGALAIHRAMSEPYVIGVQPASERWRQEEQLASAAEREGRPEAAHGHWSQALAAGGPAGPLEYEIGMAARRRGDVDRAKAAFLRALGEARPAPGAAKELASLAVEAGRFAEAEPLLRGYLAMAGPDPDALSLLAVVQTNLGRGSEALRSIADARALVTGEGWRGEELEAQVRARAGDAAGCVAALRQLETQGELDRSALRSNPEYLPIATDPAWVAFLNEKRKK